MRLNVLYIMKKGNSLLASCFFIGHSTVYDKNAVKERVYRAVKELILNGTKVFYNGGMGQFDALCAGVLCELKKKHDIKSVLVTPYPKVDLDKAKRYDEIIYPALEKYHPKIAILQRNKYLVNISDCAVVYITHPWGGAAGTLEYAQKKKIHIIDVSKSDF